MLPSHHAAAGGRDEGRQAMVLLAFAGVADEDAVQAGGGSADTHSRGPTGDEAGGRKGGRST